MYFKQSSFYFALFFVSYLQAVLQDNIPFLLFDIISLYIV